MEKQTMAIVATVISAVGLLTICIGIGGIFCLVGLTLGIVVLVKKKPGKILAIVSIIVSSIGLILFSTILLTFPNSVATDLVKSTNSIPVSSEVITTTGKAIDSEIQETIVEESSTQESPITELYYLDLYDNFEDYVGSEVKFSGQVNYVGRDNVNIKGQINGATGMIYIQPMNKAVCKNISVDDYIIVSGYVDKKIAGYLYIKDADIIFGEEAKSYFDSQVFESQILSPEQSSQNSEAEEEFKALCQEISYKSLLRTPDKYVGKHIVITAQIQQIMDGGWFDNSKYYRVQTDNDGGDWYLDDEYYMHDGRSEGSLKILKDDVIKIYAEFIGLEEIRRALTGTAEEIPAIRAYYVELISE